MKRLVLSCVSVLLAAGLLTLPSVPSLFADGGANHRVRNLHFGVSGGNVKDISRRFCCSGTLGALVQDTNQTRYILSNNHVLGLSGRATPGDDISQPGLIDSQCAVSTVVADFTVAPSLSSNVDAGIAQLRTGLMDGTGFIEDIGTISSVVRAPAISLAVAKSGRTTGFTTGSISSISTTVSVRYPKSCGAGGGTLHTFTNQVVINSSTFSAGGDSGSLIVTNNNCHQPVALLFAGSSTTTIGNPISQVLTQLSASLGRNVSFVGGTCSASLPQELISDDPRSVSPSDEAVTKARTALKAREKNLLSRRGVIGVGVGAGDSANDASIVVYVDATAGVATRLPKRVNGVKIKRVYTEPFVAF